MISTNAAYPIDVVDGVDVRVAFRATNTVRLIYAAVGATNSEYPIAAADVIEARDATEAADAADATTFEPDKGSRPTDRWTYSYKDKRIRGEGDARGQLTWFEPSEQMD